MLQVLEYQKDLAKVAVLGRHHLSQDLEGVGVLSFFEMVRVSKKAKQPIVFHARRNDEMIQALLAKYVFKARLKIVFTSTAQRHHSGLTRWLVQKMDGIITTSEAANYYLSHRLADIIIPHGVDLTRYHPSENKQLDWKTLNYHGNYGIGVFGRVRKSKGIDLIVQAAIELFPQYEDYTLLICGECLKKDADFKKELMKEIEAAGLSERILFIGKQPFSRLPLLYRSLHLVTALSRNEGFGLTPLEAMASGTAVLTSEAGAWPEIIENGVHGYTSKTGQIDSIKEKLELLLQFSERLIELGQNGRKHVAENYTAQQEAQRITDYLLSI